MATKRIESTKLIKPNVKITKASITTLIQKMVADPEFAQKVIADPRKYKSAYNLSTKATQAIKTLYLEDFKALKVEDPRSFAIGATTALEIAKFQGPGAENLCYYGG